MTQQQALDILKMGHSVYLTGEAGSGKTHVLSQYVAWLREHDLEPAITASTGIAATHLEGTTIHSWSGIGVKDQIGEVDLEHMEQKKMLWQRFAKTAVLIIDEISMLSADFVDMCDKVCRHMKRNTAPFGGMQVVFSGDFFQLPPISKNLLRRTLLLHGSKNLLRKTLLLHGSKKAERPRYAFESLAWRELRPVACYLSEQYRQTDKAFSALLSAIRQRSVAEEMRVVLRARQEVISARSSSITRLFTHNVDVDALNEERLQELTGKEQVFSMQSKGRQNHVESLVRSCAAPERLRLKKGAEVMFVKNDPGGQYVNGTQGTVLAFEKDAPLVKIRSGRKIQAFPQSWKREEDGKILAEIIQVPLRLAWAITVHKSQGMSLDEAEIYLDRAFVAGQGYVALSRVRSLDGLYLRAFNEMALTVDEQVAQEDRSFQQHSSRAIERLQQLSAKELQKRHEKFILEHGGSLETLDRKNRRKTKDKKQLATREQTRAMLEKGHTLEQIAI